MISTGVTLPLRSAATVPAAAAAAAAALGWLPGRTWLAVGVVAPTAASHMPSTRSTCKWGRGLQGLQSHPCLLGVPCLGAGVGCELGGCELDELGGCEAAPGAWGPMCNHNTVTYTVMHGVVQGLAAEGKQPTYGLGPL